MWKHHLDIHENQSLAYAVPLLENNFRDSINTHFIGPLYEMEEKERINWLHKIREIASSDAMYKE